MALPPTRSRTFIHPGPYNPVRINVLTSNSARHVRLFLEPNVSIFDGLVKPLAKIGIKNASMTIFGGYYSSLNYCVAPHDVGGAAVIAYSDPIDTGLTYMVFGNATLGESAKGKPMLHCHATIRTQDGLIRGGHIITEKSIVGEQAISVLVTSIEDFKIKQIFDPETNILLFQPSAKDN